MKKNIKWIISIICIILFLIIGLHIIEINNNIVDKTIYNLIISLKSDIVTKIFKIITSFAGIPFMVIVSIIVLFIKKLKHNRFIIILNLINDVVLNNVLKLIFKRDRPIDIMLVEESGYSFPSGHTMVACIFYGFIIYLVNKSKYTRKTKIIINSILTILILLIGVSRIYLGVHYATDVIGSYLIGISYLIIFIHFVEKYLDKKNN